VARFRIRGRRKLKGEITLSGAKNAALPILLSSVLAGGEVTLENVPLKLKDIEIAIGLLEALGATVVIKHGVVSILPPRRMRRDIPPALASKIRSSLLLMGIMCAKGKGFRLATPGGCAIGDRKYDLHIEGLRRLGARISQTTSGIEGKPSKLRGNRIEFYLPTTTGTQNVMLGAIFAPGKTAILNANTRPEITDFAAFLNGLGAKIVVGNRVVEITGVRSLKGGRYRVMNGRDEALTYIVATAATGGNLILKGGSVDVLKTSVEPLREAGMQIFQWGDSVFVSRERRLAPIDIFTAPYPGINSDMQPLLAVFAAFAKGGSTITDTRFTERFQYADQLKKLGVDIAVFGNCAIVRGGKKLSGAKMKALDIRGGAALVVAALGAHGTSVVDSVEVIDRGYERLEEKLSAIGADIERIP
jgi:UDP-N-acetylglucosamine 1-carboxyvinyltransferase